MGIVLYRPTSKAVGHSEEDEEQEQEEEEKQEKDEKCGTHLE